MLSPKTIRLFKFVIWAASFGGMIPFKWCDKTQSLIVTKQSRRWFSLQCFVIHAYLLFLVINIGVEFLSDKPNLSVLPLAFGTFMITLGTILLIDNMMVLEETIKDYINSLLYFCKDFKSRYMRKCDAGHNGCELYIEVICCGIILFPIGYGTYFAVNPRDKMFVTSPIPDPTLFRILHCIAVPGCMLVVVGVTGVLAFHLIALSLPLFVAIAIGKEIMPKKSKGEPYKTHHHLRKPFNIICLYKAFTILNIDINIVADSILLPFQNILSYCIVICNYCLIHFHSMLDIRAFFILTGLNVSCLVVWMVALWFGGLSFKISKAKLDTLHRHMWVSDSNDIKYFKKALKALQPIHLRCGSFAVRMLSTLKFLNFVIWATSKALMMFKV